MSPLEPRSLPSPDLSALERFAEELEAVYEAEKAAVGPADARAMYRLDRLAGMCQVRGRGLIAQACSVRQYVRGIDLLASHYMLDLANGHAIVHGSYDDIAGSRLDSATYDWKTGLVRADWAVSHNPSHHLFTNQVGRDFDLGWSFIRLSGKTPWRPWHLGQPILFAILASNMTVWLAAYPAIARARVERRSVWSRRTLAPVVRITLSQWKRNYFTEPSKAGFGFPRVIVGNWCAKFISNVYNGFTLGANHHATDVLEFDPTPDPPRPVAYLQQILGAQNFRTTPRHERLFALGVSNHIEHHLFPDLPVHRLPAVEVKVAALCEKYGIPHQARHWSKAMLQMVGAIVAFSFPIRTTPARERARKVYDRLVGELRARKVAREPASGPARAATTHDLHLTVSDRLLRVRSDVPLLESLEAAGVQVTSDCRKGACKSCVVTKLAGRTDLERNRVRRTIELCIARPVSDISLVL